MKICVTSQGDSIEAAVDPRFGRCAYFVFVETDTLESEAVPNGAVVSGGGAGIQAGQFVSEKGAKAVLTGSVGPNAYKTLSAAGVAVYPDATGTVKQVVLRYQSGEMKQAASPNAASHQGMGGGA